MQAVIERLDPSDGVEIVTVTDEDEYFPPPRELREVLPAIDTVVAATLGGPRPATSVVGGDRSVSASAVLAAGGALTR